ATHLSRSWPSHSSIASRSVPGNHMDGRRVDHGHDLVSLPQPHVLAGLIGDQGLDGEATVEVDAHHRPFPIQGANVPEQVIAGVAWRWIAATFSRITSSAWMQTSTWPSSPPWWRGGARAITSFAPT